MQLSVGFAVGAGFEACGEEAAGFVAADRAAPLARDMAVAGMDLDGGAVGADAEFDDPVRPLRPAALAALLLSLPPLDGCNLAVDALHPQGMPDPQRVQALQVGRQIIEHTFDSRLVIHAHHPRVFDFPFDNVRCER